MRPRAGKPVIRQITLQPHLAEVARARQFIREITEGCGFPAERVFDVTVACSEAVANAIEHSASTGQTPLRAMAYSDRLEVRIEGPGEFHPPSNARERSHRGLGLPLMAYLSDHLALYSGPRGGTVVSMTFYRGKNASRPGETVLPSLLSDETQQRLEQEAARWRDRRDELLSRTAARLLESLDPQSLVDELGAEVMDFLDCQVFFNYLADGREGALHLNAYAGIREEEAHVIAWLDPGVAMCDCVAQQGEAIIVEDIQEREDPRVALVKAYGVQAYCCHPLIVQGVTIGTLSFGTCSRPSFSPQEVEVMRSVANMVTMTISRTAMEKQLQESEEKYRALFEQHDRLYREQLEAAETLQAAVVHLPAEVGLVRVSHLYRPAFKGVQVGGDFYDAFRAKEGTTVVVIGDVSGQGVEAARLANLTKDVIRAFTEVTLRPSEVLVRTNRLLLKENFGGFVTVFLGIFDPERGVLRYASAGHPDALLRRASGEMLYLRGHSAPLGVHPEASWAARQVETGCGDMLFLYTDGVTEARRDQQMFGEDRLRELVSRRTISPDRLPQTVLEHVLAFSGDNLRDDVAMMAVSLTADWSLQGQRRGPVFAQESLMAPLLTR